MEDLIPIEIATEAARSYAAAMLRPRTPDAASRFTEDNLRKRLAGSEVGGIWDAVKAEFAASFDRAEIGKVGFAKEVAAYVDVHRDDQPSPVPMVALESNFAALIATLAEKLEDAENEELSRRTNRRSDRLIKSFLDDYPGSPVRDRALKFLRNLEGSLEDTRGDDQVRSAIGEMRRHFDLDHDPLEPVLDYDTFRQRLRDLPALRRNAYLPGLAADSESTPALLD
jgi:hypothetical protein